MVDDQVDTEDDLPRLLCKGRCSFGFGIQMANRLSHVAFSGLERNGGGESANNGANRLAMRENTAGTATGREVSVLAAPGDGPGQLEGDPALFFH